MQSSFSPPTWVEISLSRLQENWKTVRAVVPCDCGLVAVLKADAYGHGALDCCRAIQECGAKWFGVSTPAEGRRLREVCTDGKIIVLSHFGEQDCDDILDCDLIPKIWEPWQADCLVAACRQRGRSDKLPLHVEFDTGLGRQGVPSTAALNVLLDCFQASPILQIEGVMTHFYAPEALRPDGTVQQIHRFAELLGPMLRRGINVRYLHAGNSATAFVPAHVEALQSLAKSCGAALMIRPGMALYGHPPRFSTPMMIDLPQLLPVLSLKTRVMSFSHLVTGETAGYEMTFRASRPTRLALVPVGYADGLSRLLSNRGVAIIRGQKVPYAGRISMDLTLLDVTETPSASVGDEVTLIGEQGGESVSAYDIADAIGTIPDEVTCAIRARVPRILRN